MTSLFAAVGLCRAEGQAQNASGEMTTWFVFPPEFPGFAGHFPGNPVLPGIVQIMAVQHAAAPHASPALGGIKACKFLRPVTPGERLAVTVTCSGGSVAATLRVGDEVCSTMTLHLAGV